MTQRSIDAVKKASKVIAFSFAAFHIYTAGFGLFPDMIQRSVHVTFGIVLAVLLTLPNIKSRAMWALLLGVVVAACISTIWLGFNYERLVLDPFWSTQTDVVMGGIIIVAVVMAAYILLGTPFVILSLGALTYAKFGYLIPGVFGVPEFDFSYIIQVLYSTTRGLWGITTAATATSVAVFVVFGGIFLHTDGAKTFLQLANALVGRSVGGPAKVATIFSALFGMVSGSAAANASVTGNYTIPMMKDAGYKPETAAGVEAAASAGGQIAPPIMGAAAFVMAEFLGLHYLAIISAAAIPAALYFLGMFVSADVHGRLYGLRTTKIISSQGFDWRAFLQFVVPIGAFMTGFKLGLSSTYAGFWGVVALVLVYILFGHGSLRKRGTNLVKGLTQGGMSLVMIAVLAGAAQIVVAVIGITGVGLTITQLVTQASGGVLFLTLMFVAMTIIVMSMGMPTTAAYVLGVSIGASALIDVGLSPLTAHMFIFYFASAAALTPPVCAGVFVTAGIAGADWFKSARVAMWFGVGKYAVPFTFVASGAILLQDVSSTGVIYILSVFAGIAALSAGLTLIGSRQNKKVLALGLILLIVSAGFLYPSIGTSVAATAMLVGSWFFFFRRAKLLVAGELDEASQY